MLCYSYAKLIIYSVKKKIKSVLACNYIHTNLVFIINIYLNNWQLTSSQLCFSLSLIQFDFHDLLMSENNNHSYSSVCPFKLKNSTLKGRQEYALSAILVTNDWKPGFRMIYFLSKIHILFYSILFNKSNSVQKISFQCMVRWFANEVVVKKNCTL